MALHNELAGTIGLANLASQASTAAMHRYYDACQRFDWVEAERLRTEVSALMESYLDLISTMFRRVEIAAGAEGLGG